MIQEIELNLFVPSPELLVRLASGDRPLGIRAGPPRIKAIRETFFDTPDQALRRRGMACKLRQVEGEDPSVVVTVGEDPDSEGITSRSRLTAASVGAGVFETLRGDSEPATQIRKFVDPADLRPQIALDIQRLGRVFRGGLLLKPVLLLFFDRITAQAGGSSSVFHEISVRRRRQGGPVIRNLARDLKDEHHLFPDGLNRLQRAYRVLAVEKKAPDEGLSPYGLSLALAVFWDGRLGMMRRGENLHIPTFRGSGEDAARALSADLTGDSDLPLLRLGTTEPREGRAVAELWTIPDPALSADVLAKRPQLAWIPWDRLLEGMGHKNLRDPTLISALLLLTRRRLLGQLPWVEDPAAPLPDDEEVPGSVPAAEGSEVSGLEPELKRIRGLLPALRTVEKREEDLQSRLETASQLTKEVSRIFYQDVTRTKGRILSGELADGTKVPAQVVDLMSIMIRGIVDRLYRTFKDDFSGALEGQGAEIRTWNGLLPSDRAVLLDHFTQNHLPTMQVAPEWGPAFIPDMPMAGCAIGILARFPDVDGTRFFHMVLRKDPVSFVRVPGKRTFLPIEEVIRGYLIHQVPELGRAETHMFRFTTGAAIVKEKAPAAEPPGDGLGGLSTEVSGRLSAEDAGSLSENGPPEPLEGAPARALTTAAPPRIVETRQSVVVRVVVHTRMPESYQAQLLRALERQVSRKNPLIGWSDLYPVTGPLDLSGLEELIRPEEE